MFCGAQHGEAADASIEAFDDTWTWGNSAKDALLDIAGGTNRQLQVMMDAMHRAIGENPMMAYLAMMAVRLVESPLRAQGYRQHLSPLRSQLRATTSSLVLDAVFGPQNWLNEIIWRRTGSHNNAKEVSGPIHDVITFLSEVRRLCASACVQAIPQGPCRQLL